VRKWYVVIGNIVEEMKFFLFQKQTSSNRVNRRIAPPFIEKATVLVKLVEVVGVSWGAKPVQISNFEVRPLDCVRHVHILPSSDLQSGSGYMTCPHHHLENP